MSSTRQGATAPEAIRNGNSPLFRHIRLALATAGRVIDDVAEVLVASFTHGQAHGTHVACCTLAFRDGTEQRFFWHSGWQATISQAEARLLLDPTRLTEPERRLLEEPSPYPWASDNPQGAAHDQWRRVSPNDPPVSGIVRANMSMIGCDSGPELVAKGPATLRCPTWHAPLCEIVPDGITIKCRSCRGEMHHISRAEIERFWNIENGGAL